MIGEQPNFHEDENSEEDSIMADVSRVQVIKPPRDEFADSYMPTEERFSMMDEKTSMFEGSRMGGSEMPIDIDDDDMISDFDEPEPEIENKVVEEPMDVNSTM